MHNQIVAISEEYDDEDDDDDDVTNVILCAMWFGGSVCNGCNGNG